MSLINNMLRDLDQRRDQGAEGAAAVALTPATDLRLKKSSGWFGTLFFIFVLIVVVAGAYLAYLSYTDAEDSTGLGLDTFVENADIGSIVDLASESISGLVETAGSVLDGDTQEPGQQASTASVQPVNSERVASLSAGNRPSPVNRDADLLAAQSEARQLREELNLQRAQSEQLRSSLAESQRNAQAASQATPATQTIPSDPSAILSNALGAIPTSNALLTADAYNQATASSPSPNASPLASLVGVGANPTRPEGEAAVAEPIKNASELTQAQKDTSAVQEALAMINGNRRAAALQYLLDFIAINPNAHQSRETLAKLYISQGEQELAMAQADEGLQLEPLHRGYKKVKARMLLANGLQDQAVALLINRAPDVGTDSEYYELLASSQLVSRDYEGAILSYTSLLQYDQTQGKWWYGFATAQDYQGNTNVAGQAYAQAVQSENLSPSLRQRSQRRMSELGLR